MALTPARLAYANLLTVSGVTITSSAEATGYVDDNLASPARWKKWRSTTTTGDQWVKFDLGSALSFNLLAAISYKIHGGGTLKVQANSSDAWVTPIVSDTLTAPSTNLTGVLCDWIAQQNLRWIRFYFTNTLAASDYVELGAVFAGMYVEPAPYFAPGGGIVQRDLSVSRFAIGGQRSTVVRPRFHEASGVFQLQTASGRDTLRTAFNTNGVGTPVIFTLDANAPNLTFYGTVQELPASHRAQMVDRWDVPFRFVEDVA